MAVTINSRDLEPVSANLRVRYRDTDGVVKTHTAATLTAATALLNTLGFSAATASTMRTGYAKSGAMFLDANDGNYQTTWVTGVAPKYATELYNSILFTDET